MGLDMAHHHRYVFILFCMGILLFLTHSQTRPWLLMHIIIFILTHDGSIAINNNITGVFNTPTSALERADRKISAHATLETPPHRTIFIPDAKNAPIPETPQKITPQQNKPQRSAMERESSDMDIKRKNKGNWSCFMCVITNA